MNKWSKLCVGSLSLLALSAVSPSVPIFAQSMQEVYSSPTSSSFTDKEEMVLEPLVIEETKAALSKIKTDNINTVEEIEAEIKRQEALGLPAYIVQTGDKLENIAKACGRTTQDLMKVNQLKEEDSLQVGDLLISVISDVKQAVKPVEETTPALAQAPSTQEEIFTTLEEEVTVTTKEVPAKAVEEEFEPVEPVEPAESNEITTTSLEETTTESSQPTTTTEESKPAVDDSTQVTFANEELRREIVNHLMDGEMLTDPAAARELDPKTYQPTYSDMKLLKTFRVSMMYYESKEDNISLKGLEGASNLETLQLNYANSTGRTDFSAVKELKNLKSLSLAGNKLDNLDLIKDLDNLEEVNFSENNLQDLTGLADKTQLTKVTINGNQLTSLDGLENASNLTYIYASNNQIENLSALANNQALQYLNLDTNKLTNIDDIGSKPNLEILDLSNNVMNQVNAVASMEKLRALFIISTKDITDLTPLANLKNLEALSIRDNKITDVSPLAGLTELKYLHLYENHISNIDPIVGLVDLRELNFSMNQVEDITAIKNMQKLRVLFAYQNEVSDPTPILGLENLRTVNLSENRIIDISVLNEQTLPENRQAYIMSMEKEEISTNQYTTDDSSLDKVVFRLLNPIKNLKGEFVAIDSSVEQAQPGEFDDERIFKAVDAYNETYQQLKNLGILVTSEKAQNDNDTIAISMTREYYDKNKDQLTVNVPFFERDGIVYDSYFDADFPEILDPIIDNRFTDTALKPDEGYELSNPYSGTLTVTLEAKTTTTQAKPETETTTTTASENTTTKLEENTTTIAP